MTHQEPLFLTLPEARLVAISSFFTIKFGLYIMYGSDEQITMKLPQHRPAIWDRRVAYERDITLLHIQALFILNHFQIK